ncbi:hypothetical protein ACIGXM_23470 [Kitasatospora sp. NPDC052896]|uniref:hypothetical protein n=1 Tax=Kitasatospora sp. NPDC052896 TaxID=3364061 RepID=UPI0037CB6A07
MRVHRSAQAQHFTVLPNGLLQDRRLSYTARGLLADLLSRPDGWREDGKAMADTSPQGRGAIRRALKELTDAGYYRVDRLRLPDGTFRSESHVFDTPQLAAPSADPPDPGGAKARPAVLPPVKKPVKEPTLPAEQLTNSPAALTLYRVLRPEPRLRLGAAEALELAPLVAQWLERGRTTGELAQALLSGLPAVVYSPVGMLRDRLERKMPPVHVPAPAPAAARPPECPECHDPVPQPGICRPCAGLGGRTVAVGGGAAATPRGAARARAAMRATRASLGLGVCGSPAR